MRKKVDFSAITIRQQITSRGGGVEISLDTLGFKGERMAAYQNYLGGGMLGRVCVNDTVTSFDKPCTDKQREKLERIGEELKRYYHSLTNPDEDEWESMTYEQNQSMPKSAY